MPSAVLVQAVQSCPVHNRLVRAARPSLAGQIHEVGQVQEVEQLDHEVEQRDHEVQREDLDPGLDQQVQFHEVEQVHEVGLPDHEVQREGSDLGLEQLVPPQEVEQDVHVVRKAAQENQVLRN